MSAAASDAVARDGIHYRAYRFDAAGLDAFFPPDSTQKGRLH
ncbi:MAG: hypothetical protein R3E35_00165 [Rhodocyclaceae bacterium]